MARIQLREPDRVPHVSKRALFEALCAAADLLYARVNPEGDVEIEAVFYQAVACGWWPKEAGDKE